MRDKMYSVIKSIFLKYVDGENKDGVFVTIDGQQYSIKITAKKNITRFIGENKKQNNLLPSLDATDITQEEIEKIKNLFEEVIDYV